MNESSTKVGHKMKRFLAPDYKKVHTRWSAGISFGGAIGGIGSAIALAGGAAPWAGVIPMWLVFLLGGLICASSLIASYLRQGDRRAKRK